MSSKVKG